MTLLPARNEPRRHIRNPTWVYVREEWDGGPASGRNAANTTRAMHVTAAALRVLRIAPSVCTRPAHFQTWRVNSSSLSSLAH
jgi:hypothetical protein